MSELERCLHFTYDEWRVTLGLSDNKTNRALWETYVLEFESRTQGAGKDECLEFRPTIWHRFGFGSCSADIDCEESTLHETVVQLDWRDRLRILVSGRAMFSLRVDAGDPKHTAAKFSVLPGI